MIPKIIHYCWFGKNEMPEKVKECIESWKKYLPEYELMLWNEENFDMNISQFTQEAYKAKKYAFVSDYVRLYALKKYGGIYLDTDIEVLKSMDKFLEDRAILGFDDDRNLTALMGAEKEHKFFKEAVKFYNGMKFIKEDGGYNDTPNNIWLQNILKDKFNFKENGKLQEVNDGVIIYPEDFFHAKSLITGKLNITENTYAIHHHTLLWVSKKTMFIKLIRQKVIVPLVGKYLYMNIVSKLKSN